MIKKECIFLLFAFFGITSCRKDDTILTEEVNCYCCNQVDAPSQIEIGDLSQMNILYPDTIITSVSYPSSPAVSFEIDIDQDGINDLKIIRTVGGSYTTGPIPETSIETLNDQTWLRTSTLSDTLYSYTIVTFSGSDPVVETIEHHQNCIANSPLDQVISTSNYLLYNSAGEEINTDHSWENGHYTLRHKSQNNYLYDDNSNPDTLVYETLVYANSCHDIPVGETVYLGIKKLYCGEEKLGWIKLTLISGYKLHIHEVAIQK